MEQKSMTAFISAFARWYHTENNTIPIFNDSLAGQILTDEEKQQISFNMSNGIAFFNPSFNGTSEEALRWIVDMQLSPSPLGRAAFAEKALQTAVRIGATQYLIIAAGYDTFAYRQPSWATKLQIFELDHPIMSQDKQSRIQKIIEKQPSNLTYIPIDLAAESLYQKLFECNFFDKNKLSFCSLLGISYYLSKKAFKALLQNIRNSVAVGSTVVFDYPDEHTHEEQADERAKKQVQLANSAKERILASYSYQELEALLFDCGFLIYEHLLPSEITRQYFQAYNTANPDYRMAAFDHVNYCLAVKK